MTGTTTLPFVIIVIFALWIPFLIHLVMVRWCRLFREPAHRQKGAILSGLLGLFPVGILFCIWTYSARKSAGIISLSWTGLFLFSIYILFSYVYFHIFDMSETARRIRILVESPRIGRTKKAAIARDYTCAQMIAFRVKRLVALGELQLREDRYVVKRGILVLPAKVVFTLRKFLFPRTRT